MISGFSVGRRGPAKIGTGSDTPSLATPNTNAQSSSAPEDTFPHWSNAVDFESCPTAADANPTKTTVMRAFTFFPSYQLVTARQFVSFLPVN
jgi:hypothetical protein